MSKVINQIVNTSLILLPWLFTLRILICASTGRSIDWWDASFIIGYTFIAREVRKDF
jgi:hypothetical protein